MSAARTWSHRTTAACRPRYEADLRLARRARARLGEPAEDDRPSWGKLGRHVNGDVRGGATAGFELGLISCRVVSEHDDPPGRASVGDDLVDRSPPRRRPARSTGTPYVHERLFAPVARLIFAEEARA